MPRGTSADTIAVSAEYDRTPARSNARPDRRDVLSAVTSGGASWPTSVAGI